MFFLNHVKFFTLIKNSREIHVKNSLTLTLTFTWNFTWICSREIHVRVKEFFHVKITCGTFACDMMCIRSLGRWSSEMCLGKNFDTRGSWEGHLRGVNYVKFQNTTTPSNVKIKLIWYFSILMKCSICSILGSKIGLRILGSNKV